MKRRLFNLAAALSLLLGIATLVLWWRSYIRVYEILYGKDAGDVARWVSLQSHTGTIFVSYHRVPAGDERHVEILGWTFKSYRRSGPNLQDIAPQFVGAKNAWTRDFFGFGFVSTDQYLGLWWRSFWFPHWFLALIFSILPAVHLRSAIHARKIRTAGACSACGYDLRATPERCPECGTEAKTTPAVAEARG